MDSVKQDSKQWESSQGSCAGGKDEFHERKDVRWAVAASIRTSGRRYREGNAAVSTKKHTVGHWKLSLVRNAADFRRRSRHLILDKDAAGREPKSPTE